MTLISQTSEAKRPFLAERNGVKATGKIDRRLQPRMPSALFGPESTERNPLWVCYRVADIKPAGGWVEIAEGRLYNELNIMGASVHFAVKKTEKLKKPEDVKIVLLNDNYTTMDFVVDVLVLIFHKNETEAERIMMDVHRKGRGVVGTYTHDIALTKASQVHTLAEQNGFPLRCVLEPA
ncbi:MAG: ATP-dependent Clp protease adaptor ClpS [Spirochaetaceae bacterium]|jgi:ATP-dependent Clp protease adaptor protein ClpS|nr:ATP-dependent Clp protease adaptor ClpS [Spirochaetaceae bacterium]